MVSAYVYDSKMLASSVVHSHAREAQRGEAEAEQGEAWRDLDRQLRRVAARRAALDLEELTLIREAIRIQLWRRLGMTSMREYLETAMGYSPHVAGERLRVADALESLPAMEHALGAAELSYSAVRELTRIATHKTELAWLDAARGKNLRQIEELVAEREPGDDPTAPPKPDLRTRLARMNLRPAARALLRQARHALESLRGERVDDSDLQEELARTFLRVMSGQAHAVSARRLGVQIAITKCDTCKQAWQTTAGRQIAIMPAELAQAECDAQLIGGLDQPGRLTRSIPPAVYRLVMHRDRGRCTVPGCRSAHNLDVHHIVHRKNGGGNAPTNLTVLCAGHHAALHRGELEITGEAPDIVVKRRWEVPRAGSEPVKAEDDRQVRRCEADAPTWENSAVRDDAELAMRTLGFSRREAADAVTHAVQQLGSRASLEGLIRAALRACAGPAH